MGQSNGQSTSTHYCYIESAKLPHACAPSVQEKRRILLIAERMQKSVQCWSQLWRDRDRGRGRSRGRGCGWGGDRGTSRGRGCRRPRASTTAFGTTKRSMFAWGHGKQVYSRFVICGGCGGGHLLDHSEASSR